MRPDPAADDAWRRAARAKGDGVAIAVRVTPKAGADRAEGVVDDADGPRLVVKVRAAPDKGAANAAVVAVVAKLLGVPRSDVAVAAGHASRRKTLSVAGVRLEAEP